LPRCNRLTCWFRRDRRSHRSWIRCEVYSCDVRSVHRRALISGRECITGVPRCNHVRTIRQSHKCVIAGTVRCGRGARPSAQSYGRSVAGRRWIDRSGKIETSCIELVASVAVVTLGVGRIHLVIIGRASGQSGKRHLVARNHPRIHGRTISVCSGGSVIDRGVGRNIRSPNDLRAGGCDRCGLYVRYVQRRRRWRIPIVP